MTNPDLTNLRAEIWGALPTWSHQPKPCTAEKPCDMCKRSISLIMEKITAYIEERERLARLDELSNTVIAALGAIEHTVAFGRTISKTSRIAELQSMINEDKSNE